jgi:hypothetical protein
MIITIVIPMLAISEHNSGFDSWQERRFLSSPLPLPNQLWCSEQLERDAHYLRLHAFCFVARMGGFALYVWRFMLPLSPRLCWVYELSNHLFRRLTECFIYRSDLITTEPLHEQNDKTKNDVEFLQQCCDRPTVWGRYSRNFCCLVAQWDLMTVRHFLSPKVSLQFGVLSSYSYTHC